MASAPISFYNFPSIILMAFTVAASLAVGNAVIETGDRGDLALDPAFSGAFQALPAGRRLRHRRRRNGHGAGRGRAHGRRRLYRQRSKLGASVAAACGESC